MGVFSVEVKMRNLLDYLVPEGVSSEEVVCDALVDTGSTELCLPAEIVEQLGLVFVGRKRMRTADGERHVWRLMGVVGLEVQGRECETRAIELPRGAEPLLGAEPLAAMDWHISPKDGKLIPRPR